jgi:hypothetical protein
MKFYFWTAVVVVVECWTRQNLPVTWVWWLERRGAQTPCKDREKREVKQLE